MRLRYKKFIIIFTLAIMLIGMGTFSLIAPNVNFSLGKGGKDSLNSNGGKLTSISDKEVESDITMLIKNYFDAKQRVDMTELAECVSDISHVDEKRLVTEAEYIQEYKNIECTIINEGLREGTYRVYVYYEAEIYGIIDTLVPSLTALYVTSDKNGKFTIYLSEIKKEDQKAIEALDSSTDVQKMIDSVQKRLEDIVSKNADVRDFYQMLENSDSESSEEYNENIDQEGGQASATPAPSSSSKAKE
ncbi:MAG: hypothetical protein HFH73_04055 [Lachnospiraceae bacterium]|jgi:hypothetical protein|nr:hypothetical protein [Lachnospiraceae bacterium]